MGQSVVGLGDVDADGLRDYAIGASGGSGRVQVRSGPAAVLTWQRNGTVTGGSYGWDVDAVGDVDGDGALDLLVGSPFANRVHVLRAEDGALVHEIVGPPSDFFGGAVAGLGDVDGDGLADLAVGGKWIDGPEAFTGATRLYTGFEPRLRRSITGRATWDRLGLSLTSLGDVDGDGISDLATGAPQENGGPGYVRVDSGALAPTGERFRRAPAPR
jgi:hypothetical protein